VILCYDGTTRVPKIQQLVKAYFAQLGSVFSSQVF